MKIRTQILSAFVCIALAGCLHAQAGVGGVGGDGGAGSMEGSAAPALQILAPFQFTTTVGASFSKTLTSAYGVGTLTWSESGTLPSGLTLNSATGAISGTVGNNAGLYPFTVTVTDSSVPTPQTATQGFTISVQCTQLQLTGPQTWPPADNGTAYNYTIPVSGGIAPLTFAATNLPTGESINTSTGVVSGTPSVTGIFSNIGITVTDSCPTTTQSVSGTFTEQVNSSLSIVTPPQLPPATTGVQYSQQLTAAGGTPPYTNWALTAGSLPAGIGLNPSTGLLSGIATVTGNFSFTVQVTDSAAGTATLAMTLSVSCAPLSIPTQILPNGTQNQFYSFQESSTGGYGTVSWTGNGFPQGIGISTSGLVSGTPSVFGTFAPGIIATDSCPGAPQSVSINPTLVIAQQTGNLLITTGNPLPDEVFGTAVGLNMGASGGVPPYAWSNPAGAFPTGVTMNGAGAISGTPTTAGTYTPTIQVTDSGSNTASQVFSVTVTCPAESITTTSLPPATKGTFYSTTVQGTGGINPITWGGSGFPTGLTINSSTGVISGTPTQSGTFSVTITRTDSCLPSGTVVSVVLQLQVNNPPLAITTTSLPNGTLNQPYSATMSAIGGNPPYAWSITVGTLQSGLNFNTSTGVISGTPTTAGTVTLTFQVTDSSSNTATATLTLTVATATGADNRYCSTSETWTGPTSKPVPGGNAQAPKTCVRTAVSDTPSPGSTVTVTAGSCSSLQSAIANAVAGETIIVPALNGSAQDVFSNCTIKPAAAGNKSNWITVRTDVPNSLPPEGSRISPAWVGITSLPGRPGYAQPGTAGIYLPKILGGTNFTIQFAGTAAYWRFEGLELTTPAGQNFAQVVSMAGNHIILDRILDHCGNSATWQDRDSCQAGVTMQATQYGAVIDSYIGDIHCVSGGSCQQAQGIDMGGVATNQSGPDKIVNDFIESSGENLFTGGGGCSGCTIVPSTDDEVRRNHTYKPPFWATGDATYFGTLFELDNCSEMKNVQRIWFEGNIFENSWGQGSQQGNCFILGPKNQASAFSGFANSDGAGNITWTSGGQFRSAQVSSLCGNPGHCAFRVNGTTVQVQAVVSGTQLTVSPALPAFTNQGFTAFLPGLNAFAVADDVIAINNYVTGAARVGGIYLVPSDGGDQPKELQRVYIENMAADHIDGYYYNNNAGGACCVWATGWQIQSSGNGHFINGLVIDHGTFVMFLSNGAHGTGPSFGFATNNQTLNNIQITNNIATVGYGNAGAGSMDTLWSRWVVQSQLCFDHNFFAKATTPFGQGPANDNEPLPTAGHNGGCSFGATGNTAVTDFNAIQFTNNNGGKNINMLLLPGSPAKNGASDGTDAGVNWNQLQTAIAGVN